MGLSENINKTTKAVKDQSTSFNFGAVSPDDNKELKGSKIPRALYIGGEGDLTVIDHRGIESTFVGLPVGIIIEIRPIYIKESSTVTNIIALY